MLPYSALLAAEGEAQNPLLPAIYDIVWSIIPFALVLLLFWRLILPRLHKVLDERSDAIEGGIEDALTKLEQKVLDIKDRIKLFKLTYPYIFENKVKNEQSRYN